ncbi:MAG: class I SAM-dependent methyltransferase [Gammaproteobacteria bacterium]|nr:class I SAM-dependent methyltransferase [Gammaproteobacteria bacterium]
MDDEEARWEARYREADPAAARPAEVLTAHVHLLPAQGEALDLACGLGANARLLAGRGLRTHAWDRSSTAIDRLSALAHAQGLPIQARVRDVVAEPPPAGTFDVIVVAHFLERALFPALAAALRPGGLLFYQTWTREAVSGRGPANPAYRLESGELLRAFAGLRVLAYREEGRVGDAASGLRDQAWLVAMRPDTPEHGS